MALLENPTLKPRLKNSALANQMWTAAGSLRQYGINAFGEFGGCADEDLADAQAAGFVITLYSWKAPSGTSYEIPASGIATVADADVAAALNAGFNPRAV